MENQIPQPAQPEFWLNFYEKAWGVRGQFIEEELAKGTSPFAAIQKVLRKELTNELRVKQDGSHTLKPHPVPQNTALTPTGTPWMRESSYNGEIHVVPFYIDPIDLVSHYLDLNEFDAVVELGSGMGQNLVKLLEFGSCRKTSYFAGEYTKSGQQIAKNLFSKIPDVQMTSFHFDWKAPDLSSLQLQDKKVFLFSLHSCEQVTFLPETLFETLAKTSHQTVGFHFEPFGYQYRGKDQPESRTSEIQRIFFTEKKWNQNFLKTIFDSFHSKKIRITHIAKDCFVSLDVGNPTSFAAWDNQIQLIDK